MQIAGDVLKDLAVKNPSIWGEGKVGAIALHAAVAGVGAALGAGDISGAITGTIAGDLAGNLVKDQIAQAVGGLPADVRDQVVKVITNVIASSAGGAVGGMSGAGAAAAADKYNRQLHVSELERIKIEANGDAAKQDRLTRAACYEVKCWAEFPEGSPLYNQKFVSESEIKGYSQEHVWVKSMQALGDFTYSGYASFADSVKALSGLSSPYGKLTWQGNFIGEYKVQPCSIGNGDCQAGISYGRPGNEYRLPDRPDYVTFQISAFGASGVVTINLYDGGVYSGMGGTVPVGANASLNFGSLLASDVRDAKQRAARIDAFLQGGAVQGSYCGWLCVGVNHAMGGETSIEVGVGTPGVSAGTGWGADTGYKIPFFR